MNGCGVFSKKYTKTENVQYRISAEGKKKLKLDNVSGSITISQSKDSGSITIKAHKEIKVKKKYLDTPFDEIEIRLDTLSGIVSVTTEINKGESDGIFRFDIDRGPRVEYEIQIPPDMALEIENVNGKICSR